MNKIKQANIFEVGGLRLDASAQRLTVNGRIIDLRPKSWSLLNYMAMRPGVLLTKQELVEAVWCDRIVTEASLNQAVRELRKALGDDARSPRYIETVHRRGFRFIAGNQKNDESQSTHTTQPITGNPRPNKLFGREQEIARLRRLLKQAAEGQQQVCFVTGESGIGKTSLTQAFLDSISTGEQSEAPLVGQGQCIDQHGEGEAYLPILEALDRLARGPGGERVQQQLQRYAPSWLIQLPWLLHPAGPEFDSQLLAATPTRMLREFCVFCQAIATDTPLILWLEDLHWSDHSTIDLLHALARRKEPSRILVVASYRPIDAALRDAPVRQLKQNLVQQDTATELPLELLKPDGVGDYLAARFQDIEQLPELNKVIYEATDGNPLFVVTLANYLVARGLLARDRDHWTLTQPLESIRKKSPNSLTDIVDLQLQQATAPELSLLETASVVGNSFSSAAIADMLALDQEAVELTCEGLTRRSQLIITTGNVEGPHNRVSQEYKFIHDVFRRMLYDSISPARLRQLHLRAGETLEEDHRVRGVSVIGELALHFEIGGDPRRAITYLQQAAERAQRLGPASEASRYLERALVQVASLKPATETLQMELDLRLSLLRGMGYSWKDNTPKKKRDNLQRALALCEELQDDAGTALLLSLQIGSQVLAGDLSGVEQTVSIFRTAAEKVDKPLLLSLVSMWSGVRDLILGKLHSAEEYFERSIEMLKDEELREPIRLFGFDPAVASLGYSTISIWLLGFPDEARRRARLCQSRSEAIGAPLTLVNGLDAALNVEHFQLELEAARARTAALDACLEEYGVEYNFSRPMAARNWILLSSGDARAAMTGMKKDIGDARKTGHGIFHSLMYNTLAQACLAAGAVPDGMEAIEQALQVAHDGERVLVAETWRLRGELLRAGGDDNQAEECFRAALAIAREQSALSLELRSANSLGKLNRDTGLAPDARKYLEKTLERFTEGFGAADLLDAELTLKDLP